MQLIAPCNRALSDCNLHYLIHRTKSTLSSLSEWTIANKISVNTTKTEALTMALVGAIGQLAKVRVFI